MVRVRFAPSPTGFLHVGSLRTALYNYLFAKNNGGVCILRIEDTDRTRLVEGAMEEQIESLRWAGVEFDEGPHKGGDYGPYIQSERFPLYREYGMKLVESGAAYYAFDTSEELDAMRLRQQNAGIAPKYDRSSMRNQYTLGEHETKRLLDEGAMHVIRLRVDQTEDVRFNDAVRGEVVVHGREVDDQILLKSDGFPTYHLANVVDDHLMEITHVIRAEEWLPSTPKHVLLYRAFGWTAPVFAHVPLILNPDRSKMSKRHGDVMTRDFRAKGYFPDALVNFVALCGWNPGVETEMFSMDELVTRFSLERVNKAGAIFDYKKLEWMNSEYLKKYDLDALVSMLIPVLERKGYANIEVSYVREVIQLLRERVLFLNDIAEFGDYLFGDQLIDVAPETKQPILGNEPLVHALKNFASDVSDTVLQDVQSFKEFVGVCADKAGIKQGQLMKPLRIAISHRDVGGDIAVTARLIGAQRCSQRINAFLG